MLSSFARSPRRICLVSLFIISTTTLFPSVECGGSLPMRQKTFPQINKTNTSSINTGPTGTNSTSNTTNQTNTINVTNATKICDAEAPTPEVWKARNISGFLATYPNAANLTISEFAKQHGVSNFVCGISENCDAGQICSPIPGPVWHVLYSVQQWNHLQQSFVKALNFATNTLNTIGSQISIDLFPPEKGKSDHLYEVSFILALVLAIWATVSAAIYLWVPGLNVLALGFAAMAGAALATAQAATTIQAEKFYNNMQSDAFSRWSSFTEAISQWQAGMQKKLTGDMKHALESGINDPSGFGGILANGALFTNTLQKTTYDIEKSLEEVVKRRMISTILMKKKAFVTVNSDKCKKGGPNGAFKAEDGWLSWCKDGKMMNIIYADGNKSGNKIYNAGMIPTKYGISVEYMTTQSENCQKKFGGYGHDPYKDGALPTDPNADCIVNLPVCYPSADKCQSPKKQNILENFMQRRRKNTGIDVLFLLE
ncbi:hypothetical protein PSHT_12097 [Puccinia striiformis]|uniref:DUF7872 domain-containing protein n=1 Tax=Puccinia striiformis TaxID=27350 RepID=A0A2S4UYX7_9BASI|nr:hypothetical protein PSHT_12097 [Puccinia striiformis]